MVVSLSISYTHVRVLSSSHFQQRGQATETQLILIRELAVEPLSSISRNVGREVILGHVAKALVSHATDTTECLLVAVPAIKRIQYDQVERDVFHSGTIVCAADFSVSHKSKYPVQLLLTVLPHIQLSEFTPR